MSHTLNTHITDFIFSSFLCSGKSSESPSALEDLAHYEFLAHLRKSATSVSHLDHLNHNGTAGYHPGSPADNLPPAIWSPGAQHRSPGGTGGGDCVIWKGVLKRHCCFIACLESILTRMCVLYMTFSPWIPDGVTNKQACPFCRRTYLPGAAFRDHIKYCQVRDHTVWITPLPPSHQGGKQHCVLAHLNKIQQRIN